jgi:hypothetical protein
VLQNVSKYMPDNKHHIAVVYEKASQHNPPTLKMEATGSSETLVNIYQITRRRDSDDNELHGPRNDNLTRGVCPVTK